MNDLITVVIPVYNVGTYLGKCVKSVVNQTYKNLQILLIDDGSTDGSSDLCDDIAFSDSRIQVIHKSNSGLGLTRNVGINNAKGKYIIFVDSDDYLSKDLIENLYLGIKKDKSEICIAGFTRVDNRGTMLYQEKYEERNIIGSKNVKSIFEKMLGSLPEKHDSIKPSVWSNLYSVNIIKKFDLKFVSERKIISEDIIWNAQYFNKINKVQFISSCGYFYRYNNSSLSQSYKHDRFRKIIFLYNILLTLINKDSLSKDALLRAQKQLFINVRSCIVQERQMRFSQQVKDIKEMVNNNDLILVLQEYPIQRLHIKQKVFVTLLKNKDFFAISLLNLIRMV